MSRSLASREGSDASSSRSGASAQWMSSSSTMTGFRRARAARKVPIAAPISRVEALPSAEPECLGDDRGIGTRDEPLDAARRASAGVCSSRMAAAWRTISAMGQ